MTRLKSEEISTVIAGPVFDDLQQNLKKIKNTFPKSKIILSTWKGCLEKLNSKLDYDIVVENEDPGAEIQELLAGDEILLRPNNTNRLIVSRKSGLDKVNSKYTLLLRSDLSIENKKFLNYYNNFPFFDKNYKVFTDKIIVNSVYSLRAQGDEKNNISLPFHVSDFWYFGLTEDLKKLYDIPLIQEPEYTNYFNFNKKPFDDSSIYPENRTWRMSTEQYILSSLVKKYFKKLKFDNYLDANKMNIELSHKCIMSNFIFLEENKSGIVSDKFRNAIKNLSSFDVMNMYNFKNYKNEYNKIFKKKNFKFDLSKRKFK